MASSRNKISKKKEPQPSAVESQPDTFNRWVGYSALFHTAIVLIILGFNKFDISIWKKPPEPATVVWTQTVKRPQPTIPDKLPPPMVPLKKEAAPKAEEINIKKPVPEKPKENKESNQDKMKKALEALKKNIKEDDRPTPKEDNFPTQDEKKPDGLLSDTQINALQANPAFGAYKQTVKETVNGNFIWYKTGVNFVTVVSIRIDSQGNVLNTKIEKSSGDFAYDQAVLRAIEKSNPLTPPPAEFVQMFMQEHVEFTFERKQ